MKSHNCQTINFSNNKYRSDQNKKQMTCNPQQLTEYGKVI